MDLFVDSQADQQNMVGELTKELGRLQEELASSGVASGLASTAHAEEVIRLESTRCSYKAHVLE